MSRKKTTRTISPKAKKPSLILNSVDSTHALSNALGCAPGVNFGLTGQGGNPDAPQVEQTAPLSENLRYYLASNNRNLLSQAYVEIGLIQAVIDVPVDDGLRGGIKISSKQLDEDQIKELTISVDRDDDLNTAGQALKWNRLYGGAGILTIVGDQDPEEPLNVQSIGPDTSVEFRAVDMWELFWDKQNTEGYDPEIQTQNFEFFNYYASKVHKSRVMRMKGMTAPSFIRPRLRGWGVSVVDPLLRSVNQYLKATNLSFECLDEFKVDVYKIKNLVNTLLGPQGMEKVANRVAQANWQKNYQNALVIDADDDWDHKQLSFSGLAEVMQGIRMQVAADMRMPITKLFGTSASAGLGNTDQNDMENYNSMVEAQVRNKIKYDLLRMLEIKCQKLFGFVPEDLEIEFKPLRVLTAVEEETVKTQKFTRLMQAKQMGEISTEEFKDACNRDNLLGIQVDTSQDALNPLDSEDGDEAKGEEQKKLEDPGANREDRRKPKAWDEVKPVKNAEEGAAELVPDEELPRIENPDVDEVPYEKDFDRIAYGVDGGDDWIDQAHMQYFEHPTDKPLWAKAQKASLKYLKLENLKFVIWYYRKKGGAFGEAMEADRPSLSNKLKSFFKGSNS